MNRQNQLDDISKLGSMERRTDNSTCYRAAKRSSPTVGILRICRGYETRDCYEKEFRYRHDWRKVTASSSRSHLKRSGVTSVTCTGAPQPGYRPGCSEGPISTSNFAFSAEIVTSDRLSLTVKIVGLLYILDVCPYFLLQTTTNLNPAESITDWRSRGITVLPVDEILGIATSERSANNWGLLTTVWVGAWRTHDNCGATSHTQDPQPNLVVCRRI